MGQLPDKLPVLIIEAYNDYRPPKWVKGAIEKLLWTVPPKHLVGLESVVLRNSGGQSRRERRRKFNSRGRKIHSSRVLAFYSPASRRKRPHIEIYVNRVLKYPRLFALFPLLRESWIGVKLFHELGHHVYYTQRPEHREEENVADEWSGKFLKNFIRKRYWYLLPILVPTAQIVRKIKYGSESKKASR
jgi:hypothetical protein